jgi:hypothetical protein
MTDGLAPPRRRDRRVPPPDRGLCRYRTTSYTVLEYNIVHYVTLFYTMIHYFT